MPTKPLCLGTAGASHPPAQGEEVKGGSKRRRGRGDYLDAASARQEVCCSITPVSKLQLLSIIVVSFLRVGLPCGNRKQVLGSRSGDAAARRPGSPAPRKPGHGPPGARPRIALRSPRPRREGGRPEGCLRSVVSFCCCFTGELYRNSIVLARKRTLSRIPAFVRFSCRRAACPHAGVVVARGQRRDES